MSCPSLLQSTASSFHGRFLTLSSPSSARILPPPPRNGGLGAGVKGTASGTVLVEKSEAEKTHRLKASYLEKIVPLLKEEFKYTNVHQVPKIEKIVVNCGIGDAAQNAKGLESAVNDMALITGQRPIKTRARASIATFKIREGQPLGIAVTLRGNIMYSFLDRLINLALPRARDFQGVSPNSFDGHGNYSIGIRDQSVFPEIRFDAIGKARGMDVCITTTAKTDQEGQKLLALMGMPFREGGGAGSAAGQVRKKKLKSHHFESKGKGKGKR
ncbi:PREDICTED: 50S ribosomal protein L5, chloroplastic [Tarenaya hassleriana]|uniref:50S ribosomal protein L5, chloroplastic n=1 Tax=Tarenaya hassleriana TaxID=28532 RepID=UPI00053C7E46|nr:PREDICTED: 50S ribosomal protein L5, chloroplastic [Tarenaya hassleriana]